MTNSSNIQQPNNSTRASQASDSLFDNLKCGSCFSMQKNLGCLNIRNADYSTDIE